MKKGLKIFLSIIGGIEVTFTMFMPILLAVLWVKISVAENWTEYLVFILGLLATLFRALKIGWLNNGDKKW